MSLQEDEFYMEEGKFVLTELFHWRRGHCCGNGCRHCPFEHERVPATTRARISPPTYYFGQHPTSQGESR